MRTLAYLIAIHLFSIAGFSQVMNIEPNHYQTRTDFVRNTNEVIQVLDSTYYSTFYGGAWHYSEKKCIHSRHAGTQGLPNEWYNYTYNSSTDLWDPTYYEHYTYLSDTAEIVNEQLVKPYNMNTLSWESDSMLYYNYTGYTSSQFGVMLDNYIVMNYFFSTYNFIQGTRCNIFFENDTLYDYHEIKEYNGSTCTWDNSQLIRFFYDANNFVLKQLLQTWNASESIYKNTKQYLYSFQNGLKIQEVEQTWDDDFWENAKKTTYTYTAQNLVSGICMMEWDTLMYQWANKEQQLFSYTAGLPTEEIRQFWDTGTNAWVNFSRQIKTYNTNGDMLSHRTDIWNGSSWDYSSKYTWTYNTNNQMTSELYELYSVLDVLWIYDTKHTYTYDGNDCLELHLAQSNDGSNNLINWQKDEYDYDVSNNNTLQTRYSWDNNDSVWNVNFMYEYYYSAFDATSLTDFARPAINMFPNPTTGFITINPEDKEYETITITDASGKVMFNSLMRLVGNSINLAEYGKGLYNIILEKPDGEKTSSKIVVY